MDDGEVVGMAERTRKEEKRGGKGDSGSWWKARLCE